jgi:BirA family biotin operon repressor/biotin-[acetyl-CoA-carboxylase] ligase
VSTEPSLPDPALSIDRIRAHLKTRTIGATLRLHDEVDSTNRLLGDLGRKGAPHGTVVLAESQTAGRGRQGRRWLSPPGMNLYCSVLLVQASSPTAAGWVPLLAAVAVARAIRIETGLRTCVKWPNDVESSQGKAGRKIAGILAEATGGDKDNRRIIVLGIGVNVNAPIESFPPELQPRATSLLIETEHMTDRARLLAALLNEIESLYESLLANGALGLRETYLALSNTLGKQIRVELVGGEQSEGMAETITEDGALSLRLAGGRAIEIRAGDVVHLR